MANVDALEERREQIRSLLTDAITVLCKNTMLYCSELSVEGLLGITTDKKDIFLVNIKEIITNNKVSSSDSTNAGTQEQTSDTADNPSTEPEELEEINHYSSSDHSPSPHKADNSVYNATSFSMGQAAFPDVITIKDEPSEVVVSDDVRLLSPTQIPHGHFLSKDIGDDHVRPVMPTLSPQFRSPLNWPAMYTNQQFTTSVPMPAISGLNAPSLIPHDGAADKSTAASAYVTSSEEPLESTSTNASISRSSLPMRTRVQKTTESHISLGKNIVTDRYYCSCGQQFRHSSSLTRHLRMNDQAKRGGIVFKCHLCGSKMNRRDNLRSHLIKNHGVKFGSSLESTITRNSLIMNEASLHEHEHSEGAPSYEPDREEGYSSDIDKPVGSLSDETHDVLDGVHCETDGTGLPSGADLSDEVARLIPKEDK